MLYTHSYVQAFASNTYYYREAGALENNIYHYTGIIGTNTEHNSQKNLKGSYVSPFDPDDNNMMATLLTTNLSTHNTGNYACKIYIHMKMINLIIQGESLPL